jgi:hypothetical protein
VGVEADKSGYVVPPRVWAWLGTRRAVAVLLWVVTLCVAAYLLTHAWGWFDNPATLPEERRRADGNSGHTQIDFGGQWVMGRMIVRGHARELYHRQRQWEVVREGFPVEDEPPLVRQASRASNVFRGDGKRDESFSHDSENLMSWFMGTDPKEWRTVGGAAAAPLAQGPFHNPFVAVALQQSAADAVTPEVVEAIRKPAVGGPLYPPVHAFFYAPLALFKPLVAYHIFQVIALLMVFVAALGVKVLTRGRVWWSVASLILLLYPGTRGGLDLGQNPSVTLAIAIWGWALASRGYNTAGGMIWGLFAFKPVWALAFLLVPILTRRWRFLAAMVVTGAALCLATLPFVGIQTWFDWLTVGQKAAALYNVNENWTNLSRDLQGIPRRMLHDFSRPEAERDTPLAKTLAWTLWGVVFATTVVVYLRYADHRRATGVGAGFLFFGAWLTCYRFMYYDALVSAIGCAVLFAEPARFLRTRVFGLSLAQQTPPLDTNRALSAPSSAPKPLGSRLVGYLSSFPLTMLAFLLLVENSLSGMELEGTVGFGYYAQVTTSSGGMTGRKVPRLTADTSTAYPWETFIVMAMWAWCGWRLIRGEERDGCLPHDQR